MFVYRISKTKYINDLSGTGAKLYGGRWNEKGIPLVYTSSSISLAILESLVHFSFNMAPPDMSIATIYIPDNIFESSMDIKSLGKLPNSWNENLPNPKTQQFIKKWINNKSSLILKVPSAINSREFNYLINPLHKDINLIILQDIVPFSFDKRLI